MFSSLNNENLSLPESVVLSIHLFNISKGFECTGLQEDDPTSSDLLPDSWNRNTQLYSFRYTYKSTTIFQKLLKMTQKNLSIHTVCSHQPSKVYQHTIDLTEIEPDHHSGNLIQSLITKILTPYEDQLLKKLEFNENAKKPEAKESQEKKRSILEDDVPYGVPYNSRGPFAGNPFGGVPANPYSSPFGVGNRVGPNHPIFANPPGSRWEAPDPFFMPRNPDHFMPQNPDHFMPPGNQGPFQPFGRGGGYF